MSNAERLARWLDTLDVRTPERIMNCVLAADELRRLQAENESLRSDAERYRWLANRVLACDYGDNDAQGRQVGWRIRHDLLSRQGQRQPAFMFGDSIDAAIDAARKA